MSQPRLASISVFPVKSCAGIDLATASVGARGLVDDRCWMLIDADGRFMTGRQLPALVRVKALPDANGLHLSAPGMAAVWFARPDGSQRRASSVWGTAVDAADCGDAAAAWFSDYLGRPVRLLYADPHMQRPLDPRYAQMGDQTAFADGFPLLLLSQAAVDELTARAGRPLSARHFRPNLLVDQVPAHAEDRWRRIRIGTLEFDVVKPCTRCVFTTIDPDSGVADRDGEPLRTLKQYRRGADGITFGQNLIARGEGTISVGDAITAIEQML
jgi:hypothetical protein